MGEAAPRAPSIDAVLADPSASTALKDVLRRWAGRDLVDAAHDAELLSRLTSARVKDCFGEMI